LRRLLSFGVPRSRPFTDFVIARPDLVIGGLAGAPLGSRSRRGTWPDGRVSDNMACKSLIAGFHRRTRHMTKTTIALAATVLMSTASVAMAGSAKRHPVSAKTTTVRVYQSRNMSMMPNSNLMMNVMDRASSPFACGG
jgi:hypothetical protein